MTLKRNRAIWIAAVTIICTIVVVVLFSQSTPVNGLDNITYSDGTPPTRYYLAQPFYSTTYHTFYYHGVLEFDHITSSYASDYLVIGNHRGTYYNGGCTNMYIRAEKGMAFRIDDKTFILVDYAKDWIDLEVLPI